MPYRMIAGASGLDGGERRRASYTAPDGAVVHFRVVGPNVTASTIKLVSSLPLATVDGPLSCDDAPRCSSIQSCISSCRLVADYTLQLNTSNFVLRLRGSLAVKLGVREASWASRIYFCGSGDTSASCNVTKLVEDLADDWFHIDLAITWADFPTLAQVTDTCVPSQLKRVQRPRLVMPR